LGEIKMLHAVLSKAYQKVCLSKSEYVSKSENQLRLVQMSFI
jgi:hypothetical protein